jgi:hypothetical protein
MTTIHSTNLPMRGFENHALQIMNTQKVLGCSAPYVSGIVLPSQHQICLQTLYTYSSSFILVAFGTPNVRRHGHSSSKQPHNVRTLRDIIHPSCFLKSHLHALHALSISKGSHTAPSFIHVQHAFKWHCRNCYACS